MPGRQKTDTMRENILAAATSEFARRDFHEVLMDDVAASAHVGKGTLYRYFPTKEKLFVATVLGGLDGFHEEFKRAVAEDQPLKAILEAAVARMLTYFWGKREFLSLLQRHEHLLPPAEAQAWRRRRLEFVGALAGRLERETRSGGVRSFDSRLAAELLLGMVRTAVMYGNPRDRVESVTREIVSLFLNGIVKHPTSQARRPVLRAVRGARG
ncbi:MAG TPA: TetR/AcrR family transcriptional regulator [Candidatus Bathyarchaeia archaeon]|nr:TetR/AcrR family transcriptional regulator [Candidatus Bathyarchaeia archaeon]